jgi:hypothetical protein
MPLSKEYLDQVFDIINFSEDDSTNGYVSDEKIFKELNIVLHEVSLGPYLSRIVQERIDFNQFDKEYKKSDEFRKMLPSILKPFEFYVTSEDLIIFDPQELPEDLKNNSKITIRGRDKFDEGAIPGTMIENEVIYICLSLVDLLYKNEDWIAEAIGLSEFLSIKGALGNELKRIDYGSVLKICPRLKNMDFYKSFELPKRISLNEKKSTNRFISILSRMQIILTAVDEEGDGCLNMDLFRKIASNRGLVDPWIKKKEDKDELDLDDVDCENYKNFTKNIAKMRKRFGLSNQKRSKPRNVSTAPNGARKDRV